MLTDSNESQNTYHTPVLLKEAIGALDIHPDGVYADATFGGGGHSRAILAALSGKGALYGFDQDLDAMANAPHDDRFTFVRSNFEFMPNFMRFHGVEGFDGILADLGVSSHHFDDAERGFSFRSDAPLDMRMNKSAGLSAADIVNNYSEKQLSDIFAIGSDLRNTSRLARAIVTKRATAPILTTIQLSECVARLLNPKSEKKDLAQIFQALRIEVNHELDVLVTFLKNCSKILHPGGRLAIITYHSLEDRLVKNLMRSGNVEGKVEKDFFGNTYSPWRQITRTPVTPSDEEIQANPRSRSAKLRVAEYCPHLKKNKD